MSTSTARVRRGGALRGLGRTARSAVGVEAGDTGMRFAQQRLSSSGVTWSLASLQTQTTPGEGGSRGRVEPRDRESIKRAGISRGAATCALASPAVDVFPLSLRPKASEALENLVVLSVRERISYSLEEAVLDYAVLPDRVRRAGDEATAVLVFSAPRSLVEDALDRLERLALRVEQLLTPACVLAPRVATTEQGTRHLLISTGEEATSISVAQDGHVLLERILPWGLRGLVAKIGSELDLPADQCRALLGQETGSLEPEAAAGESAGEQTPRSGGTAPGGQSNPETSSASGGLAGKIPGGDRPDPGGHLQLTLAEILGPRFEELSQEAAGCLGYCDSFLQPWTTDSGILVGPLASHLPLREFLTKHLAMPVLCAEDGLDLAGWGTQPSASTHATAACCALWSQEGDR